MSAFPKSGRSDRAKLGEIRVRFRPQADISEASEIHQSFLTSCLCRCRSVNRCADGERHEQTKKGIERRFKMKNSLYVLLILLAGCGSGDDDKQAEPVDPWANPTGTYMIAQCTIYWDGFAFWDHCRSNSDLSNHSGPYPSLDACRQQVEYLISSDTLYMDDSAADRSRGWAIELFCAQIFS